jgi:hypothetical protein
MREGKAFSIRMIGDFYSFPLYNESGGTVHDLETAIAEAERQYHNGWRELFNGDEGITNEEV